jgi:hypothetical protein
MSAKPESATGWPACGASTIFSYSFCVWPVEQWGFGRDLYQLFGLLSRRIEMEFTEEEFEKFRSALNRDGFSLREIERVPYLKPEDIR